MGSSRHQVNPVKLSQLALAYSCSARSHARGVPPCYSRQTYCTPHPQPPQWRALAPASSTLLSKCLDEVPGTSIRVTRVTGEMDRQ